jgi:hypothetical protein
MMLTVLFFEFQEKINILKIYCHKYDLLIIAGIRSVLLDFVRKVASVFQRLAPIYQPAGG